MLKQSQIGESSYCKENGSVDCEKFYRDVLRLHFEAEDSKDEKKKKRMQELWDAIVVNQDKNFCCKYVLIMMVGEAWRKADGKARKKLLSRIKAGEKSEGKPSL